MAALRWLTALATSKEESRASKSMHTKSYRAAAEKQWRATLPELEPVQLARSRRKNVASTIDPQSDYTVRDKHQARLVPTHSKEISEAHAIWPPATNVKKAVRNAESKGQ